MNVKVMVAAMSAVAAVTGLAADNVVENQFKATLSSNTPLTAYEWFDSSIWDDEAKGAPFGWGAKATPKAECPQECFYMLPEGGVKLSYLQFKRGHYLGDVYTAEYSEGNRGTMLMDTFMNANYAGGADLFGDYHPISRTAATTAYLGSLQIAGRIIPGFEAPATEPKFAITGAVTIRHDLFAESADPVRAGVVDGFGQYLHVMNGSIFIVGPQGSAAKTSSWSQTAGSVFIKNASNGHGIVPGMTVTGDGVPSGTFVKYVFPLSTWIALSNPIEEGKTKESNSLQFSAITPSVSETYSLVSAGPDCTSRSIIVARKREADEAKLTIGEYRDAAGDPSAGSSGCAWGVAANANYKALIPGEIILSKFTLNSKENRRSYVLNNVRLTFNCDVEEVADTNPDFHWSQTGSVDSRVTVAEGKTVYFSNFHDLVGTIDKRGAGKLVLPLKNTVLTGTVKVTAGEFVFKKTSAVAADAVLHLGRLELSAGTVLTIPAAGMTVDAFVGAEGAVVKGGPLTVSTDSFSTMPVLSVMDGGSFVTTRRPLTREAAVPSADRWLHLDASDASTLVTEKEGDKERVVRWNDVSGGAINARPYPVPGGFENGSIYVANACNGLKAVDLGAVAWRAYGTANPLSGDGKTRVMFFFDGDTRFSEKGNADYIVNTAFFMVGSQGGGGTLLNCCGEGYYNNGMPHTGNPEKDMMISAEITPSSLWNVFSKTQIDAGTILFRENGETVYPQEKRFSGGWDVIAYRAGSNANNRKACGFGMTANGDGRFSYQYDDTFGGLAYGEVILFTNHLSTAQFDYVEAYLMKKWKNVDTEGFGPLKVGMLTLDADSSVDVSGDKVIAANVTGAGTVNAGLEISEGAILTANVDSDGQIETLSVVGKLELPTAATLAFAGSTKPARGVHVLYSAEMLVGDVSEWTVTAYPGDRGGYRLFVEDNKVKLQVSAPGLAILVQ